MSSRKTIFWIYNCFILFLYFIYRWLDMLSIMQYQPDLSAYAADISVLVVYALTPVLALLLLNFIYARFFIPQWSWKRILLIALIELVIGVPLFAFLSGLVLLLILRR
jgi:hypothetical protein